jgi:hypothetical protein
MFNTKEFIAVKFDWSYYAGLDIVGKNAVQNEI